MNDDRDQAVRQRFLGAYDAHADGVFRFGLYKLSDKDAALDLVQDTFMRYWDTLRKGAEVANEHALIFTIARRLVIDRYRAHRAQSLDALTEAYGFDPADAREPSPERAAEHALARKRLEALPEPYREALVLRYVEGFEPREIAALLGETANAVTVRIHRGLAMLKERLHGPHTYE